MMSSFEERAKEALAEAGLNQTRLAKLAHMDVAHMGRLLKGVRDAMTMSADNALTVADLLNVTVEWLFRGTGPKRRSDQREPTNVEPRQAGVAAAHLLGFRQDAIDWALNSFRSKAYENADKYPPLWWLRKIERKHDQLEALAVREKMAFISRGSAQLEERRQEKQKAAAPAESVPSSRSTSRKRKLVVDE